MDKSGQAVFEIIKLSATQMKTPPDSCGNHQSRPYSRENSPGGQWHSSWTNERKNSVVHKG